MIEQTTVEDITEYANLGVKEAPDGDRYTGGVQAGWTAPAKWWNYLFNALTKRMHQTHTDLTNISTELANVVVEGGGSPSGTSTNQLVSAIRNIIGRGTANGTASLDASGRIPYSQLPESAVEIKGDWDATNNIPELADGIGDTGDTYYVDVGGTRDLGHGDITFIKGDRVMYLNGIWKNMSSGSVNSVNGKTPTEGNVTLAVKEYTYIVDSNQALSNWFNNVPGNDYSYVLIKKGTWEYELHDNTVFFTNIGTLFVKGENGSTLNITGSTYLLQATSGINQPISELIFDSVNINLYARKIPSLGLIYGITLNNCNITVNKASDISKLDHESSSYPIISYMHNSMNTVIKCNIGNNDLSYCNYYDLQIVRRSDNIKNIKIIGLYGCGFNLCNYMYNCSVVTDNVVLIPNEATLCGFMSCEHLNGCIFDAYCIPIDEGYEDLAFFGYYGCLYLNNCVAKGGCKSAAATGSLAVGLDDAGFYNCYYLSNCEVSKEYGNSSSSSSVCAGFLRCKYIDTSNASLKNGNINGHNAGFYKCRGVRNCTANVPCNNSSKAYGFEYCWGTFMCGADLTTYQHSIKTSVFYMCSPEFNNNINSDTFPSSNTVANSANGGWNDTNAYND